MEHNLTRRNAVIGALALGASVSLVSALLTPPISHSSGSGFSVKLPTSSALNRDHPSLQAQLGGLETPVSERDLFVDPVSDDTFEAFTPVAPRAERAAQH